MAASTITRDTWTNDTGTAANPNADGTVLNNAALQNNVYARIDEMFAGAGAYATLTLGGKLAVEGFGTNLFSAGGTGFQTLLLRNTTAGTGNGSLFQLGNNSTANLGAFYGFSSTFTTSGAYVANGVTVEATGVGGLSLDASNASGDVRLYSRNGLALTLGASQAATFTGLISSSAFGTHSFSAGGASNQFLQVTNTTSGATASAIVGATAGTTNAWIVARSQGYTTGTYDVQASGNLYADGAGGWSIIAAHASGDIRIYNRNTLALTFGASQAATFTGSVTATAATFSGTMFVGDTSNANSTLGLTLNQAAADNEILTLKSSDVAHALTSLTETDTFAFLQKFDGNEGGLLITGVGEGLHGVVIHGVALTEDNTRSTTANGPIMLRAFTDAGGDKAAMSANQNMVVFYNGTTQSKFIFDSDGDSHEDGTGWTAYDDEDDVAVIERLEWQLTEAQGNPIDRMFTSFLEDERAMLETLKLVTFNDNGHHFVNRSRMQNLLCGAVRQLAQRVRQLEEVRGNA